MLGVVLYDVLKGYLAYQWIIHWNDSTSFHKINHILTTEYSSAFHNCWLLITAVKRLFYSKKTIL